MESFVRAFISFLMPSLQSSGAAEEVPAWQPSTAAAVESAAAAAAAPAADATAEQECA